MKKTPYLIIDSDQHICAEMLSVMDSFKEFICLGIASTAEDGLDIILEHRPELIILDIDHSDHGLSLSFISELHRYLDVLPKIIVTSTTKDLAFQAIQYDIFDFILKPATIQSTRRSVLRFNKSLRNKTCEIQTVIDEPIVVSEVITEVLPENVVSVQPAISQPEKPLTICVKSYGDYRFISAADITYLQADNNSTDIHLSNGEMITAFKTLKHFENVLNSPFVRIHNSHIVNIDFVSRIHTGNSVCYIRNTAIKLPFSKSYKENIDNILLGMTKGNYLEI